MKKFFIWPGLIVTMLLLLMASSTSAQKKLLVFSPQWHAQAQFAGYIMAQHLGYYDVEGLDVRINFPTETTNSLDLLSEGKADLVTNMLATAIVHMEQHGVDLVNVMQTAQHSSLCLVRKPGPTTVESKMLSGMRVGLWYNGLAMPAEIMNAIEGLSWKAVSFREGFNLMNYDMVDAITAMEYNELLRMKYCGRDVSARSVLHLCDVGYDIPEDGIYCTRSYYQEHKAEVDAFIRASKKGWEWCRQHPDDAVDFVVHEMRKEFIYSSRVIQRASLKVILEKQKDSSGMITYALNRQQFEKTLQLLTKAKFIHTTTDFKSFTAQ